MTAHKLRLSRYRPGVAHTATSTWTSISDIGHPFDDGILTRAEYERVEELYLKALSLLLEESGTADLLVSDIELGPAPSDEAQLIQEGSVVGTTEALEICRLELREELSCRLDDDDRCYIHVGFDYYVYVGCARLSPSTIVAIEESGLFIERGVLSPYSTV